MAESSPPPLKLRARDVADMDVIAAVLQDALVPLRDLAWLKREKRFVLVANRFMWEQGEAGGPEPEAGGREEAEGDDDDARFEDAEARTTRWRCNAALVVERVRAVRTQGVDLGARDQFLNLLTIASEPKRITLYFSEGARLRLDVSEIRCHLTDLGEPWPTWSVPRHEEAEA